MGNNKGGKCICCDLPGAGCSKRNCTVSKACLEAGYPCCPDPLCSSLLAELSADDPPLQDYIKDLAKRKLRQCGSSNAEPTEEMVSMAIQTKCIISADTMLHVLVVAAISFIQPDTL